MLRAYCPNTVYIEIYFKENLQYKISVIGYWVQTAIWNANRKVWMKGPDLATEYTFGRLFPSVINSTTIIIIKVFYFGQGEFTNFVCMDVPTNTWTYYPNFPNDIMPETTLASTVSFDKNGKRYDKKRY